MAVIVLLFAFLVGRTRYFRQAYYIGGNARAAKLSGINVDRTVFSFFVIMGLLAGLAGALLASRLNTAVVLAGQGVELKVITAVVLGGASLSGGVGTIFGAFLGVLFMALLQNAMIIAGINPFWQLIVVGIVLLISVGLDQFAREREAGRDGVDAARRDAHERRRRSRRRAGGGDVDETNAAVARSRCLPRLTRRSPAARRRTRPGWTCRSATRAAADQEYVWISNASNLPLFVERVYPGLEVGAQGAQRQGAHRRPDLGRPRRLHHHRRCRMHQEPGRRDRRRRLGRRARLRGRQVHRQEGADRRHRRRPADLQAPHLSRHQLVQSRLPARPVPVPLPRGGRPRRRARSARSRSSPPATSSRPARACATRSPRNARTSRSWPTRNPAPMSSRWRPTPPPSSRAIPNLTGMVGFDSEAGPGIVRAVTEAGKAGKIIITSNEAGRDFLNTIKDGTVKMINMEKYETMDFFAVLYLYTFHNDIIRNLGMDHWLQNPLPAIGDSGLIFVTAENVDTILAATAPAPVGPLTIESPGRATALPDRVASRRIRTEDRAMTRTLTPPAPVSLAEFDAMFESVKNWGRWGPDDERGTLNYLTPDKVAAAARAGAQRAHRLDGDPDQQGGRARTIPTPPCTSCR